MKYFEILSPEYSEKIPILDDGSGPTETGKLYLCIKASSKRIALALAVAIWRKSGEWQRLFYEDEVPFKGMTVHSPDSPPEEKICESDYYWEEVA